MPQQGAERRARPRMGRVISGDPEMGSTARRATGAAIRTSACRRSAPSFSFSPGSIGLGMVRAQARRG